MISLIKQTIQRRSQTRSLLNTDLGIAGKGCAAGTAWGPWGCGDAVLGRARTRHPGTASPFLPFPCLSTAGPALPRPFLPLPAGRCFSCQQSGLDDHPSEGRGSSRQRGRKSCWQSEARGAQGGRRGFGRAGLPLLRTLAQVKQRAELTGSSYPRLLPAHPINHSPNEFVFTDEMFLAAETSRRLYLPLIVSSRSDNLYQEMVLNFQFRSRWGSRLGTCRYSFGSDDCNDLGDFFSVFPVLHASSPPRFGEQQPRDAGSCFGHRRCSASLASRAQTCFPIKQGGSCWGWLRGHLNY